MRRPMKRSLCLLVSFFVFSLAARADSSCYGAWLTTLTTEGGVKEAGAVTLTLHGDITSIAGTGAATLEAVNNGSTLTFTGVWTRTNAVIRFELYPVIPSDLMPTWRGKLNLLTGQCNGTWRGGLARGKFQTTLQ